MKILSHFGERKKKGGGGGGGGKKKNMLKGFKFRNFMGSFPVTPWR